MGTAGISIFVASGDAGTGKQGMFGCKKFNPVWPASSPYVTAVGGTYVTSGTEFGWNGSGGGFSAMQDRPAW
jgi:tripeptidyl-peptidase I